MTMKVLIADDATAMAGAVTLGAQISWPGCQVTTALDSAQALRLFAAEQPESMILLVTQLNHLARSGTALHIYLRSISGGGPGQPGACLAEPGFDR
jgi:hypothetical protein